MANLRRLWGTTQPHRQLLCADQRFYRLQIPNFDTTRSIVTERRIRLLREASQAFSINSNTVSLFRKVCEATEELPDDLPLVAIYDCSASDEERDNSADNSSTGEMAISQANSEVGRASGDHEKEDGGTSTFTRAAVVGIRPDSKVFPIEIPQAKAGEDAGTIGTKDEFLTRFREIEKHHKQIVLDKEDLETFADQLDKTQTGDQIETLVMIPLKTVDNALRAIAIVGLNPRQRLDADYQVFLDLWKAQLDHGLTSVRLVNEEIRRARFMSALIKRKNEELHQLLAARTQELRDSEMKFATMASISPVGIWRANPECVDGVRVSSPWVS